MEAYKINNLSFAYPNADLLLKNINLSFNSGEFILLCGRSGSGKTTLLRHLKPILSPAGTLTGGIDFFGDDLKEIDLRQQSQSIGYVMQLPEQQIVTDKVWHELAFGLESLGYDQQTIRLRVAEIANFFGIESWFYQKTTELSGGQKQLLNLASIMAMQPKVLILDEPTSQLDPIMANSFLETLKKINDELGVTVILSEQRLENVFAFADQVVLLDNGEVLYNGKADKITNFFARTKHPLYVSMPTPIRVHSVFAEQETCPVDLKSGRQWLNNYATSLGAKKQSMPTVSQERKKGMLSNLFKPKIANLALDLEEVYFRYDREGKDILKSLDLSIKMNTWHAVVGGNGAGKTTLLKLLAGLEQAYRGKVKVFAESIALLPQDPQTLFVGKSLKRDLEQFLKQMKLSSSESESEIARVLALTELTELTERHPYDLSGGEQQRAALAKVLLLKPQILLLDEPTKGLDGFYKLKLAEIIRKLINQNTTVVMVSHDIEFCAENANYCSFLFSGEIVSSGKARQFFMGNSFYTTMANKIARDIFPDAIVCEDIIKELNALQGKKYDC